MADISQELSAIKNSVYGKNMRTAIHDAIKKVNEDGGGGGGGGITITTLWSSNDGTTVGTTYDLSDDISNYDILLLKISSTKDLSDSNLIENKIIYVPYISTYDISINGYYQRSLHLRFSGATFQAVSSTASGENSGYAPKAYAIVGVKF